MTKPADQALQVLGGLSAEHFLREYWQKKPLLIRQAFPEFESPVTPDELAGLALEEEVESRIILERDGVTPWELRNGPFEENSFAQLPETHWTLLIQQLDAWNAEINALKQHFNFIPNWRIDDIMASYAPFGGSVGPHYDQYDVFLIQAQGHRHWQTGQHCNHGSETLDSTPLSILKRFDLQEEWTLAPGDMLYLPPGLAHHGVAQDDCITLSVGFRAPTNEQILSHFSDYLLGELEHPEFYSDPDLDLSADPALIESTAIERARAMMQGLLNQPETFAQWFCEFTTQAKNEATLHGGDPEFSEHELLAAIDEGDYLNQNEGSRFVYHRLNRDNIVLAVDGDSYVLNQRDLNDIQHLCAETTVSLQTLLKEGERSALFSIVMQLIRKGSLYFS